MTVFRRLTLVLLTLITLGLGQAHAAVINAQLIDSNPGIRGLTYIDGVLTQDELIGDEVYDDRFTGFILQDPGLLLEDITKGINIYDSTGTRLIATLAFGANMGTNFVHTSYYSDSTNYVLTPLEFAPVSLIADGTLQTVLEFTADNGDQYIFQYAYVEGTIPEPSSIAIFALALGALGIARRRMSRH